MHIISIIIIVAVILYLYFSMRSNASESSPNSPGFQASGESTADTQSKFAFISRGKLFVTSQNQQLEQIQSAYVQDMISRMDRKKRLHGWKENTSLTTSFVGNAMNMTADQVEIQVASAQFTPDGNLLYFMKDRNVGGLFSYDMVTREERRLLHRQNLSYENLAVNADNKALCSQYMANGIANIVMLDTDGTNERVLTEGDTLDTSPSWIPGEEHKILYQSAGLARNEEGYVIAYGPTSIELLNLDSGNVTTVLEDDKTDFLQPRVDTSGNLYFIQRPYDAGDYGGINMFLDFIFFPFRLARAVFHYLNFFSLMYSRKPLTTASGPRVNTDIKDILIKGKRIDAEKALRKEGRVNGIPSLVPKTWQLVQRTQSGKETVLATNVASFDLTSEDNILFSNGYAVFLLSADKRHKVIIKDKLIADIVAA